VDDLGPSGPHVGVEVPDVLKVPHEALAIVSPGLSLLARKEFRLYDALRGLIKAG
jgi:hypothetical protein